MEIGGEKSCGKESTCTIKKHAFLLAGIFFAAIIVLVSFEMGTKAEAASKGDAKRGEYIFNVSAGCGCHGINLAGYKTGNPPYPNSAPFGDLFEGPFGSVPTANITPDKETGIGSWTDRQIIDSMRKGVRPDGSHLFPIMPSASLSAMSVQDTIDLVAYLRSAPPVKNKVPAKKLNPPPPGSGPPPAPPLKAPPATAPKGPSVKRGEYLVTIGDCGGCHNTMGPKGPVPGYLMAGNVFVMPDLVMVMPNITPDKETGIGKWSADDITAYLATGSRPDGKSAKGEMAAFIEKFYSKLTDGDLKSIGQYLKTIPPVKHIPKAPPKPKGT